METRYNELFNELDKNLELRKLSSVVNITSLEKEREMFELSISNILDMIYGRGYTTSEELMYYLNSFIRKITDILNSRDNKKIDILLSGEFNKDAMYRGWQINEENKKLPLYFILDLIIGILEKNNAADYYKNVDIVKDIVSELKELRSQTSTLKFNDKFKSLEVIDDYTLDFIIENNGAFELDTEQKKDFSYLVARSSTNNAKMPLYRSDKDKINEDEYKKSNENKERLERIIKNYFKNGTLPPINRFKEELIDVDINNAIRSALLSLCIDKSKYIFIEDLANASSALLSRIEKLEEKEKKDENDLKTDNTQNLEDDRDIKITLARLRYRQKSLLWKFFHKKQNPEILDLNKLSNDEIDSLYRRR